MVRLTAIFAHPDDDTFGLAGTLALEGPGRVDYSLIVATSGEAGIISDPALATAANLAQVREGEEREALEVIGFGHAGVHFLRHPDGGLKELPRAELVDRITALLAELQPDVVVTFGPDGITRHDDHIAVGRAATDAFHRARESSGDGTAFRRLYHVAIPNPELQAFWQSLRARGVDVDADAPFMPRGVPARTIAVRVDCRVVVRRKLDALLAHRTQQGELESIPEDLRPRLLGQEWFVQAWPPPAGPVENPRTSLFEDLGG